MNAREIARGLTKAQREAVLAATQVQGVAGLLVLPVYRDGGALNRSLVELDLAGYSSRGIALKKLGKQVRAILQEQNNER
jgi:hypothetical protein